MEEVVERSISRWFLEICSSIKIPFKAQGSLWTQSNILFPLYTLFCFFSIAKCREGNSTRKGSTCTRYVCFLSNIRFSISLSEYVLPKLFVTLGKLIMRPVLPLFSMHYSMFRLLPLLFTCRVGLCTFKSCHLSLIPVVFAAVSVLCFSILLRLNSQW